MTLLTLTPTPQPRTGANAPLDITALLAAGSLGSNTGVSFTNTGREVLHVQLASAEQSTIIVAIGTTIEGEPVTSITYTAPTAGHLVQVGPFDSDEDQPGGTITVTFGTAANVSGVALVQNAGAF